MHALKMSIDLYIIPTEINSKKIIILNAKSKTAIFQKENLRPQVMQIVLSKTLKIRFLMEKIWEIGLHQN